MIRLLLADDHAIVRSGLGQIFALTPDVQVAAEACNGLGVMDLLRQDAFDLLLMDLNMPGISGVDLIVRIKALQPDLPLLVLSMHDSPHQRLRTCSVVGCHSQSSRVWPLYRPPHCFPDGVWCQRPRPERTAPVPDRARTDGSSPAHAGPGGQDDRCPAVDQRQNRQHP